MRPTGSLMFASLLSRLGNNDDARVAENVIHVFLKAGLSGVVNEITKQPEVDYGIDTRRTDAFTVRVRQITHFSDAEHRQVFAASQQIVDIEVRARQQKVYVLIRRATTNPHILTRCSYTALDTCRRRTRTRDLDWVANGITNLDDCERLTTIIDDTNNMYSTMPSVRSWLEIIDSSRALGGGAGPTTTTPPMMNVHRPLNLVTATDDSSESEVGVLDRADAQSCVGFALCFTNLPDFSTTFFDYLRERHGLSVTRICVWFMHSPGLPTVATLVVNVRRMAAADVAGDILNKAHRLRGDPQFASAETRRKRIQLDLATTTATTTSSHGVKTQRVQ